MCVGVRAYVHAQSGLAVVYSFLAVLKCFDRLIGLNIHSSVEGMSGRDSVRVRVCVSVQICIY